MAPPKKLGELLKEKGYVNDTMFAVAMAQQKITGQLLGTTLQRLGFVSAREMAETLAEQSGMAYVNLYDYKINEDLLRRVPRDVAEKLECIPLAVENGAVSLGITNPTNVVAVDRVQKLTGMPVKLHMVDSDSLADTIEKVYYFMENPIPKQIETTIKELMGAGIPQPSSISNLTELIIKDGIRRNATDIHITPGEFTVNVFYRVDGVMHHSIAFPKEAQSGVISKIKVLSSLDIAEQRLPQDGFLSFTFLKKNYDMRVSTLPTIYGENTVIRILTSTSVVLSFDGLGFDESDAKKLKAIFNKPHGIVLITGPTGSGKTTTLYSALRQVNLLEKNVLTVEDPVEIRLTFVRQTQVNLKSGYDFSRAGRSFMRQDPDVMLLGEIRDEETAHIATRAAITGHLVLTTLHTNDAITAVPRLLDLKIDKFNLSAALLGIVAQRLVRKICTSCKVQYDLNEEDLDYLKAAGYGSGINGGITKGFRGTGCPSCQNTGFRGRTLAGEIFILDDELRELISTDATYLTIKNAAVRKGMKTMLAHAIDKFLKGITSLDEIKRVVG